jgi:L-amino acid N-acyltransferase YncA
MSTVFAVEPWAAFHKEAAPLFVEHWREVALNHDDVPLDIAYDKYNALATAGALHVLTARRDGELIGYHIAVITGHMHYLSTVHGITDVYWLAPAYRTGRTGLRMFQAVERELKKLGVRKLFTATKLHLDQGALFEYLGYKPVERLYAKLI